MKNDQEKGFNYDFAKSVIYSSLKDIFLLESEVNIKTKI